MTASSAPTAEPTRARTRIGAGRGRMQRSGPNLPPASPVLVARFTMVVEDVRQTPRGRAECLAARRLERRQRHKIAACGLAVLAAVLILTVVVLDVLH